MEPYIFFVLCFYIEWKSVRLELLTSIYDFIYNDTCKALWQFCKFLTILHTYINTVTFLNTNLW